MATLSDMEQLFSTDLELRAALDRVDTKATRRAVGMARMYWPAVRDGIALEGSTDAAMFVQWANAAFAELNQAGVFTRLAQLMPKIRAFDFAQTDFIDLESELVSDWGITKPEVCEIAKSANQAFAAKNSIFMSVSAAGRPQVAPMVGGPGGGTTRGTGTGLANTDAIAAGIDEGSFGKIVGGILSAIILLVGAAIVFA